MTDAGPLGRQSSAHDVNTGFETDDPRYFTPAAGRSSMSEGVEERFSHQPGRPVGMTQSSDLEHLSLPPSESISRSSTARGSGEECSRRQRSKQLGPPSSKQLRRAAIAGNAAPEAGGAAPALLARDRDAQSWRDVQVDDKDHIWSDEIAATRRSALKTVLMSFAFITVWLWICLPIFWGSTYSLESFFPNVEVYLVSFDTDPVSFLNGPFTEMAQSQASSPSSTTHLGWSVRPSTDYPNGLDDVRSEVSSQRSWATVVINTNATTAWREAVRLGDASYDPSGAVTVYSQTARFYQVSLLYIEALVSQNSEQPSSTARAAALRSFISSTEGGATAISSAAAVPQAIGVGFSYTIHDLRPIENGAWAGSAPMEAASIYYVIFAFYVVFFGAMARMKSTLASRLQFRSLMKLRLGWPVLAYFFISLWFTLIERAWQIPFTDYLGSAGFVTLWALNYVTIIAAGFALDTMSSLVGVPWLPFFSILWIILNITSSFYPLELLPRFYRLLRWTPFIHNVEGFKIVAYGTDLQHRLGLHFGILFALIGVELICLPLAIFFERWQADRSKLKKQAERDEKG